MLIFLLYVHWRKNRMDRGSHQNAGFSIWVFKNFSGAISLNPTAGGGHPYPHQPPARSMAGRGAQAPQCCRDPNLGTPQRFSRNCAPTCVDIPQSLWHTDSVSSDLYGWLPSRYPWRVLISRPAEGRRLGWPEWLVATLHSETVHTRERLTTNLTRRTVT